LPDYSAVQMNYRFVPHAKKTKKQTKKNKEKKNPQTRNDVLCTTTLV